MLYLHWFVIPAVSSILILPSSMEHHHGSVCVTQIHAKWFIQAHHTQAALDHIQRVSVGRICSRCVCSACFVIWMTLWKIWNLCRFSYGFWSQHVDQPQKISDLSWEQYELLPTQSAHLRWAVQKEGSFPPHVQPSSLPSAAEWTDLSHWVAGSWWPHQEQKTREIMSEIYIIILLIYSPAIDHT